MTTTGNTPFIADTRKQSGTVFAVLWLIAFAIYLPTAKAGWVIDASGWLYNIRHLGFWDYINNKQSHVPSLYQFTQFTTYVFYKLFNANPYAWHTLMVTMYAINSFLFYKICYRLFSDAGIADARQIALTGVLLYTFCPHLSETIVWEASYHYLQGFLLLLIILAFAQKFIHQQRKKYAVIATGIFICSAFSLEVFYIIPWVVLTLGLYYRYVLGYDAKIFRQLLLSFFVPFIIVFVLHIMLLRVLYSTALAHIPGEAVTPLASYFCKPAKYIFHFLFLGRYFSFEARDKVYKICDSAVGLVAFYGLLLVFIGYIIVKFKTISVKNKTALLLFTWVMLGVVILLPISFPYMLLVFYDRYTYFFGAFTYMIIALMASHLKQRYLAYFLLGVYGLINLYFTIKVNLNWKHATYIDNRLMKELPDPGNKTVILLNIPENMNGIAMIGAQPHGQYKAMRELFVDSTIKNHIWDAASYNLLTPEDGAHVTVKNDSVIGVTLNQWGTWWWYEGHGGISYETTDYKLDMINAGHYYELTLKKPSSGFLLLYNVGSIWKTVDMSKQNVDQY